MKQYNQAGVAGAKIDAKSARETAEQRTKERQIKERDAIRSAESSREVERKLASARQQLEQTRAMMAQQGQATTQNAQAKKQYDPDYEANKRTVTAKEAEILKLQTAISDLTSLIQSQQKTSDEKSVSIESLQAQLDNPPPDAAVENLKADKKAAEDKQGIATLLVKRQTDRKSRLANELVSSPNDAVLAQQIRDLDAEIKRQRMSIDEQDLEIAQLEYKIANPPKPTTETDRPVVKEV